TENRAVRQRAWYFSSVTVHPTNPDVVWCPQVPLLRSIDGGKTFQRLKGPHHGDHHDVWIDPKDPRRAINSNDCGVDLPLYASEYGGYITRYDRRTRQARSVSVYPYNPSGHAAAELKYRFQWTAPVLASRHERGVVYHAANVLFRSDNGGQSWAPVSPDLTR